MITRFLPISGDEEKEIDYDDRKKNDRKSASLIISKGKVKKSNHSFAVNLLYFVVYIFPCMSEEYGVIFEDRNVHHCQLHSYLNKVSQPNVQQMQKFQLTKVKEDLTASFLSISTPKIVKICSPDASKRTTDTNGAVTLHGVSFQTTLSAS
jgi:hypothetical protein